MQSVAQALAQAWQCLQSGQLPEAEGRYRQIVKLAPTHVDAWYLLAMACQMQGKLDDAVAGYREALRLRPDYAEVHSNLGVAYKDLGKLDEAVASLREAARLNPSFSAAHNNLGLALADQKKLDEAVACYREAIRLDPNFHEAHYNLGRGLQEQGNRDDAIACYRRALELQPNFAEAHNNLGAALFAQEKHEEASASLRQALALDPRHAQAHLNLGFVLGAQDRLEEAIASYRRAIELRPEFAEAHNSLGIALTTQVRPEKALACLREAIRLKPDFADAHSSLGALHQQMGELAQAEASAREALKLDPRHAGSRVLLIGLQQGKVTDEELAALHELLADPLLGDDMRSRLQFRAAMIYDVRGEYAEAGRHLQEANVRGMGLRQERGKGYDPAVYARFVDGIIATFTPEFFARVAGWGLESERPTFVFGLPRSGTTLIEQILASHSQVHGAGELGIVQEAFRVVPAARVTGTESQNAVHSIDRDALGRMGEACLVRLGELNATAARIVDKMPENYVHLGLLAAMFPRGRFIHCRRDLRDVAVSCWITDFHDVRWSHDMDHIAARFREYQRMMEHWKRVLPVPILEMPYEEVVADLEREARRLVAGCGLEWEPKCLAFYETRRPVRTASVLQVRQPIYTRSVGRWRHYTEALAPLFAQLEPR